MKFIFLQATKSVKLKIQVQDFKLKVLHDLNFAKIFWNVITIKVNTIQWSDHVFESPFVA